MSSGDAGQSVGDSLVYARRLRRLFDSLPALIAYWDRDLHNSTANVALLKWYGMTPEQVRGMHIRDLLGAELYETDLPFITAALRGEEQVLERDLVDAAGVVRHTQTTYVPDVLDGASQGFFAVDADITSWVEATRALDEAQQLAQVGSSVHDLRSGVIVWTDELYRIFGEDPESFIPTTEAIADRVHPDDVDRLRATQAQARASGQGHDSDYRILRPDGSTREVHGREMPHEGPGAALRLLGTVQDLTEIHAAARELARVNSELVRVNEINADVLAMLGHDLRTPLTVMLGSLEELIESWDVTADADRLKHVQRVRRGAQRIEVLVEDILSMAAADAGELTPNLADVDVAEAVGDALSAISAELEVQVSVTAGLRVRADPFHVRQIVTNLITNALRYGEPPVVVTAVEGPGPTVTVRVRDHGQGVSDDAIARLFERFAHSGTPKPGLAAGSASGFGLYIAARMAVLDQGELVYEPVDPGSCFALTLPRSDATR